MGAIGSALCLGIESALKTICRLSGMLHRAWLVTVCNEVVRCVLYEPLGFRIGSPDIDGGLNQTTPRRSLLLTTAMRPNDRSHANRQIVLF